MRNVDKRLDLDIIIAQMAENCAFSLGKEHLLNIEPSFNKQVIKRDLSRMKEALTLTVKYGEMPFNGFRDISQALNNTLKDKTITAHDCLNIIAHLNGIKGIKNYFKEHIESNPHLDELVSSLSFNQAMLDYLHKIFDDYGEIKDTASNELHDLRIGLRKVDLEIKTVSERFKKENAGKLVDGIVTARNNRVVVLAKASDKHTMGGFVHGESSSGQAVYIEPPGFIELNNRKINLTYKEEEEIERILFECSQTVKKEADYLLANLETVALLDSFFARAKWGKDNNATTASLTDEKMIVLKKARHPLIDKKKVVSNNYNIKNPHRILLITGPNTGGKTISLKIIGLMVLMTYAGMPISVDEAFIPFFDRVFIDIGDEQSVVDSLSTFSAHLSMLADVCNHASENSLVLLDELGSGTDPKEGECLAIAILNELRERKCMLVATTHYGRLKNYGKKHDDILVAMVQFDVEKLEPTYKFIEGITGHSNAFDIAYRYGLNEKIIKYAEFLKNQNKSAEDELIEKLEGQLLENQILQEKLNRQLDEVNHEKELTLKLKNELESKKEAYLEQAKADAELYLEERKEEADAVLAQLRNLNKTNLKYHEALNIKKRLDEAEVAVEENSPQAFKVGDTVLIKSGNQLGVITNIKKDKVNVDVRGINVVAKLNNLKHTDKKISKPKVVTSIKSYTVSEAKFECNLIGKTVEEGLSIMDKFLDNARVSKLPMVRIIHGDGSGALRKAVHDRLRNDHTIREFRLGMPNEGGTGATVVLL